MKIGIFYGSSTGNTESVATQIAKKLNVDKSNLFDVSRTGVQAKVVDYDVLVLGSSTWGDGEVEDDWNIDGLKKSDLKGKKVAVFGTGDSSSFPDTFCNGMSYLADAAQVAGAELIGNKVKIEGYTFDESLSVIDGYFVGLAIDEENESKLTDQRIDEWVKQIQTSL